MTSPPVMATHLQKSYLPPPCTPPPQRRSAHGWVGREGHPGKHLDPVQEGRGAWRPKQSACWVTTEQGQKLGNRDRAGEGGLQGIWSRYLDWGNQGVNIWSYT